MVKVFSTIVGHGHNVGVVVLVVVIKAVKEKTQSDPTIHRSVDMPCGWTLCALKSGKYCSFFMKQEKSQWQTYLCCCVPKSKAVGTYSSSPSHFESKIHLPPDVLVLKVAMVALLPVKVCCFFTPNHPLLTSKTWSNSDAFFRSDSIPWKTNISQLDKKTKQIWGGKALILRGQIN